MDSHKPVPTESSKRQPTDFVKRMRELDSRIKPKLLWYSKEGTSYVKEAHGDLCLKR